jgi:hypothetical protein
MKNLITLLALATLTLTACQKTQYADEQQDDTTAKPTVYIYGRAIDSFGAPKANMRFEVAQAGNSLKTATDYWVAPTDSFATDALGNFHFTMHKPQLDPRIAFQQLDLWLYIDDHAFISTFRIKLPASDSINLNDLSMINLR